MGNIFSDSEPEDEGKQKPVISLENLLMKEESDGIQLRKDFSFKGTERRIGSSVKKDVFEYRRPWEQQEELSQIELKHLTSAQPKTIK